MIELTATIREKFGRKTKALRRAGVLPAILYGDGIKDNLPIEIKERDFERVFQEAGESSIIKLKVKSEKLKDKEIDVLIHQVARDPLSGRFLHIDFFHPSAKKEIEAEIPLVFKGEAPAVKDLGGVLVREIQAVEVKGLAQRLPREIVVDISSLKTFESRILIKDLDVPKGVRLLRGSEEIVALVTPLKEEREEAAELSPVEEMKPEEKKSKEGAEKSKSKI